MQLLAPLRSGKGSKRRPGDSARAAGRNPAPRAGPRARIRDGGDRVHHGHAGGEDARRRALEFYGTALIHAYRYLFECVDKRGWSTEPAQSDVASNEHNGLRNMLDSIDVNPYDPQFRGASDLYNQSLEGMLRLVRQEGELRPGMSRTVKTANHTCSFEVVMHSTGWHAGRHRPPRVRQRLQGARAAKPLSHLRTGRAADRRAEAHADADPAEHFYPPNVAFRSRRFCASIGRERSR